jgi:hypothetical protein
VDAIIRYYLHTDPDTLDDQQWAKAFQAVVYCRREEARHNRHG